MQNGHTLIEALASKQNLDTTSSKTSAPSKSTNAAVRSSSAQSRRTELTQTRNSTKSCCRPSQTARSSSADTAPRMANPDESPSTFTSLSKRSTSLSIRFRRQRKNRLSIVQRLIVELGQSFTLNSMYRGRWR